MKAQNSWLLNSDDSELTILTTCIGDTVEYIIKTKPAVRLQCENGIPVFVDYQNLKWYDKYHEAFIYGQERE